MNIPDCPTCRAPGVMKATQLCNEAGTATAVRWDCPYCRTTFTDPIPPAVAVSGTLTEEQCAQIRKDFEERYTGAHAGRVALPPREQQQVTLVFPVNPFERACREWAKGCS